MPTLSASPSIERLLMIKGTDLIIERLLVQFLCSSRLWKCWTSRVASAWPADLVRIVIWADLGRSRIIRTSLNMTIIRTSLISDYDDYQDQLGDEDEDAMILAKVILAMSSLRTVSILMMMVRRRRITTTKIILMMIAMIQKQYQQNLLDDPAASPHLCVVDRCSDWNRLFKSSPSKKKKIFSILFCLLPLGLENIVFIITVKVIMVKNIKHFVIVDNVRVIVVGI